MQRLPMIERGDGPAVLFAHGTLMDHTMFRHQVHSLRERYRAISYNLRAGTDLCASSYTNADLVDDCLRLMDDLSIERCVLGGLSMGGFMAIDFALKYPERVAGIILLDTMAVGYTPDERALFGSYFDPLDVDGPLPQAFIEWFTPVIFSKRAILRQPELIRYWTERWAERPARSVHREYRSWIDKADMTAPLANLSCGTLIIHGSDDAGIDVAQAHLMHRHIAGAQLRVIEGCGHASSEEAPAEVNAAIHDFLGRMQPW